MSDSVATRVFRIAHVLSNFVPNAFLTKKKGKSLSPLVITKKIRFIYKGGEEEGGDESEVRRWPTGLYMLGETERIFSIYVTYSVDDYFWFGVCVLDRLPPLSLSLMLATLGPVENGCRAAIL